MKLSCGTVIRQNDGSQDELVRLYNELVSDNTLGINYSNFSRYLDGQEEEDEGEGADYDDNDDGYGNDYYNDNVADDDNDNDEEEEDNGDEDVIDRRNVSFSLDAPLEKLQNNKKNRRHKIITGRNKSKHIATVRYNTYISHPHPRLY